MTDTIEIVSGVSCPICGRMLPTGAGSETAPETLTLTYYEPRDWWVLRHVGGPYGECGRALRTLSGDAITSAAQIEFGKVAAQ